MLLSKFDKLPLCAIILLITNDFSIFCQSIIFIKRYCLMRNPKESFPLFIPEHFSMTHNPTKNYELKQNIESNVYLSNS